MPLKIHKIEKENSLYKSQGGKWSQRWYKMIGGNLFWANLPQHQKPYGAGYNSEIQICTE